MAVARLLRRRLVAASLMLAVALAAPPALAGVWDLGSLAAGGVHSTQLTVANLSCKGSHTFTLKVVGAPWLVLQTTTVKKVKKGKTKVVPVKVDLTNVPPGTYQGQILVLCVTCPPPPKCTQSATQLELLLLVTGQAPTPPQAASAPTALTAAEVGEALVLGAAIAREARAFDRGEFGEQPHAGSRGLLVAEGDSWFDYPGADVLKMLERKLDYQVDRVSHKGDTLEDMSYNPRQLAGLAGRLKVLKDRGALPRAVLVSGGGNDLAGPELGVLLNHRRSGLGALDTVISTQLISRRLQAAMISLLASITELCRDSFGRPVPILIHGYDYPVPDGRGFLGGYRTLPGPWLKPAFRRKGFDDSGAALEEEKQLMRALIQLYNVVLEQIPRLAGFEHVYYVRVAGALSSAEDYQQDWADELHPSPRGFRKVAELFDAVLRGLP